MTTQFRCKNDDLDTIPHAFHSHHECKTVLPLDEVMDPEFFTTQYTRLLPADQVTIVRYEQNPASVRQARPVELVVCRVLESNREGVKLFVTGYFDMTVSAIPDKPVEEMNRKELMALLKKNDIKFPFAAKTAELLELYQDAQREAA